MHATETASIVLKTDVPPHPEQIAVRVMKSSDHDRQPAVVQLEIGLDRLESLFNQGELCAADVRCLNCASRVCIWNLCLTVCARRMQCNIADMDLYNCRKQQAEKLHTDSSIQICLEHEHLEHIKKTVSECDVRYLVQTGIGSTKKKRPDTFSI
jgi:hypothetical protein